MICALVLAAGQSRRMGTQKLLLPLAGQPLIARVVDAVSCRPVNAIFVVIRPAGDAIRQALSQRSVSFVINPAPESEMLDSVRCGLRALPALCRAVLVVPGDLPDLTADLITLLISAFERGDRGIAVPIQGGRRSHPLLFAMRYRDEILQRYDGTGLRGLLQAHPDDVLEVAAGGPMIEDMDTLEDYRRALVREADTGR